MKWRPIETAPKVQHPMFVVIAIDVIVGEGTRPYTTDPYCVWWSDTEVVGDERIDNKTHFARWPHRFPPTHWAPLPIVKVGEVKNGL